MTYNEIYKKQVVAKQKSSSTPTNEISVPLPIVGQPEKFEREKSLFLLPRQELGKIFQAKVSCSMDIPFFKSIVQAGIPAPIEEFIEGNLDLNQYLIKHKASTFFVRVVGESMIGAAIFPEDLLVVDRSIEAISGKIIIALLNGGLVVKRLYKDDIATVLCGENEDFADIKITDKDNFLIWGVVTNVIHSLE